MAEKKIRRSTHQRQIILQVLRGMVGHPTAAEVHEIARKQLPKLSLGTVYRNLELLAHMDVIRKIDLTSGEARFDGDLDRHNHVRCVECGRVDDLHGDIPDVPHDRFVSLNGYDIMGHKLEFFGLCPECQGSKTAEIEGDMETNEAGPQ